MKGFGVYATAAAAACAVASASSGHNAFPSALNIPTTKLSNGVELPMAGLGTWQYNNSRAGAATALALELGYTHIDTAFIYGNQEGIGEALKASDRPRDSYFITSKIPGGLSAADAEKHLETCLEQLQTDYVDLMLIHFPATMDAKQAGGPKGRQEEWRALEKFYKAGKAKAIGVSHYCERHLEDVMKIATVPVMVNQVQFHVGMGTAPGNATDDKAFDNKHGVLYESFSPLCGPCGTMELINGTMVTEIGKKYGKSGAQVSLKWIVQQGVPVIPKTDKRTHMLENVDLFSWELSAADMETLTKASTPPVAGPSPTDSGDCSIP